MSAQFLLCCYVAGTEGDIRSWDILTAVISMAAYLYCVKAQVPKLLFIYTLVVDYIMIVRGIAVFLDIRFFTEPGHGYTLLGMPSSTIIRLIPFIITAPFMLTFLDITKRRGLSSHALQLWRTIWLIPALTSFIVLMFTWNLNIISVSGMTFLLARVSLLIIIFYRLPHPCVVPGILKTSGRGKRACPQPGTADSFPKGAVLHAPKTD